MPDFENIEVKNVFNSYPVEIKEKMFSLRSLIFAAASNSQSNKQSVNIVTECLKWGEASYICKTGSTIRLDWKSKDPSNLHVYLNCKSKLIETMRIIYADELGFEGNRIILIPINKSLPKEILMHCFSMALNYHKIKHLPLLGA